MKTMLKHRMMNTAKKDDLKDVDKEATTGVTVKEKETKKNQETDEAGVKKDPKKMGNKKLGEAEAEVDKDGRSKGEERKSGGEVFDAAIKIVHAEIAKKKEGSGPGRGATSIGAGKEGQTKKGNHGSKKTESDVKKLSEADGGEKVVEDGEEAKEGEAKEEEAKEMGKEAARRILGLEPAQDEEEELKEKGKTNSADKLGKEGTSDMQGKEVSANKPGKGDVSGDKKKESLEKVSSDKKDSLEIEKISADKKDSDVEKVLTNEKASSLEKALEELEPSKEDKKCCGFMGIEPVGGR